MSEINVAMSPILTKWVWNEAIEAAAKYAEETGNPLAAHGIRCLRKDDEFASADTGGRAK